MSLSNHLKVFMKNQHRCKFRTFLKVLFLCSLAFCLWFGQFEQIVTAQSPDATQLVEEGLKRYDAGDFQGAIPPWEAALNFYQKSNNRANVAIVNENLARAYQQLGESESALGYWEQVVTYYRSNGELQQMGRMMTEMGQTYSNMGQPGKAIEVLKTALEIVGKQQDKSSQVAALGSLGDAYRLQGEYENAIKYLEQAKNIKEPAYQSKIFNSLGNVYMSNALLETVRANSAEKLDIPKASEFKQNALNNNTRARESFETSLELARKEDDKLGQMQALLNLIQLYYSDGELYQVYQSEVEQKVKEAIILQKKLPVSRHKVYAAIDLANLPVSSGNTTSLLIQCSSKRRLPDSQAKQLLLDAVKTAQTLKDARSESFALGALGHFYECNQEYTQALELTNKALWVADQKLKAKDSLYLWEWQAGRLLLALGKKEEATAALERAYITLEEIRSDILQAERDLQFDFLDVIKPLYTELAQLRLELASVTSIEKDSDKRNKELTSALQTIDSLKLAELQNFFGDDCVLVAINQQRVDELLGNDTAVFSSIILDQNIAIVLSLPNGEKRFEWLKQNSETAIKEIEEFRKELLYGRPKVIYDNTLAGKLYDWMIRPFEQDLNPEQIKTLVFIQDGILRTIPMAALYDSKQKQFLVQKYAIAMSPSLSLTDVKKLNNQENRALILGLTKEAKVDDKLYPVLPNVSSEIKQVQSQFPDNKQLVDKEFTSEMLQKELNQRVYPIIHIATHAQFGIIPEDTFIVTGEKNGKITINDLEKKLRQVNGGSNAVELLALTACETALGDERAALGLAGVALQAGVRSTLASLWAVEDESTSVLVKEFYAALNSGKSGRSKAEALREAQIKLINANEPESEINDRYRHPGYWAPFILIGNWR
jgi:CHAT domain-containing protein/lipopolysaccharide biosynthesis regulator YciM